MPRRKQWRRSEERRSEWRKRSRTDGDGAVLDRKRPRGKYTESPERMPAKTSPEMMQAGSPERMPAKTSPEMMQARSPERMPAEQSESHEKKQAYDQKQPVYRTELDMENIQNKQTEFQDKKLLENALLTSPDSKHIKAKKDKQANISQFKQLLNDLSKLIENVSSNVQTDFDAVFLDTFPGVDVDYQSRVVEKLSERADITVCSQKTMFQQHAWHDKNNSAQQHFNRDSSEPGLDNDVMCYEAVRSSEQLWNASYLVFGSFHQNDVRFPEQSRGYQCTCNALCMLSYSSCLDIEKSSILDKVLCEGDVLYRSVINKLREDGKFIHHLLTLEEIPDDFKVEIGRFTAEKLPIVSGVLLDTQNLGLPTLHEVLQSVFLYTSSGLLTIGAICSAVFRKNGMYVFFDSHSHGENGLSSNDGTSCFITFTSINDLVTYMYAFYDSLNLDTNTNLQFDFLPIKIRKTEETQSCKDQMEHNMESYFNDQRLRQAHKAQSSMSSISSAEFKQALGAKRKSNRMEYYKIYKRKCRQSAAFKAKEKQSKQFARTNSVFKTKEKKYQFKSKQSARTNPVFKAKEIKYQFKSKQSARTNPVFKAKETKYQMESKQSARKDPVFKTKERESKQSARTNPAFKAKETKYQLESKQSARTNPVFKAKETVYQLQSKQSARKDPVFKTKERESKQSARINPEFKAEERESKQSVRTNPVFKAKETVYQLQSKQSARKNQTFNAKERIYQNASKKKARENPYFLECERIKKQQVRQEKRKFEDNSGINVPRKRCKHDTGSVSKPQLKDFENIENDIKQFHTDISIGPLYVCSCCHQTWFRKSVSMLKNTHIPAESKREHCTNFISVNNKEWICHTCLSALRDSKIPKLSVSNGMKWPIKPPELNLHQLEERLIALHIPFMQIRELPRGGQYSLKGNVINVPVDIQPTINCLPRPMDDNFTVAIQLKKKLSYKTVDFKENVRPLRVLTALHWLMNNSKLYKNSGIVIDDDWFQEVTESAEETVREFLGVSREQTNDKHSMDNENQEQITSKKDTDAPTDYDSDHYSEIDANDHVGNIDTLVDDADIDNKCDKVFTFAPGEGQHPLSLYNDKDAEYLCFPSIFCGQTPPSKEERIVPVHYSDIVKWELRSVDRRAAQSVPNIFFKHKKLQMKQISDKVNLAVRRCKKRGQKITAAEARDANYLDKLVNLDEGYYIFRQLRNSPAYLEMRKKDIFCND